MAGLVASSGMTFACLIRNLILWPAEYRHNLVALGLAGLWGWSYLSNSTLIADTEQFVSDYRVNADTVLTAATVSDDDVMKVLPALDLIRNNPVGFAHLGEPVPLGETFGLSQRDRLSASSEAAYRQALERMLRSRLILRVESQLEASLNTPIQTYEALKVYMMLGGKAPSTDDDYIDAWFRQAGFVLSSEATTATARMTAMTPSESGIGT